MPGKRFLRLLLFPFMANFIAAAVWAQDMTVPDDLLIQLVAEPVDGIPANQRQEVSIDATGTATLSEWAHPDGIKPAVTLQLSAEAMERIWSAIVDNRFFELKDRYVDERIAGGDYAMMRIQANGRDHTVISANIKVTAFDTIVIHIDRELPDDRWVLYNALVRDDYQEVER